MDDDTRAETALRRALTREADAFEPAPLEPRTDRRRRGWVLPVAAAAAAVLVVGGGLAVTGALGGDEPVEDDPPAVVASGGDDVRPVWWRDVAVDVPVDWEDGREPDACTRGVETPAPYVATRNPSEPMPMMMCGGSDEERPQAFGDAPRELWAPHVTFSDADDLSALEDGEQTFDGWTLTARTLGDVQVRVWSDAATADVAERVLASVRTFEIDPNGCDVRSPVQAELPVRPAAAFDVARVDSVDSIAVCQYSRRVADRAGLMASQRLVGDEAETLLAGLRSAPAGGGPDRPDECVSYASGDEGLVVRLQRGDRVDDLHVYYDWCWGNGVDDGTTVRALTEDTCAPLFGGPVRWFSVSGFVAPLCD